jgi:hypothetical protein
MRLIRDGLLAIMAGFVIALVVASTGNKHLLTVLWAGLGTTAFALALILLADWKRKWLRQQLTAVRGFHWRRPAPEPPIRERTANGADASPEPAKAVPTIPRTDASAANTAVWHRATSLIVAAEELVRRLAQAQRVRRPPVVFQQLRAEVSRWCEDVIRWGDDAKLRTRDRAALHPYPSSSGLVGAFTLLPAGELRELLDHNLAELRRIVSERASDSQAAVTKSAITTPARGEGSARTRRRLDSRTRVIVMEDHVELRVAVGNALPQVPCEVTGPTGITHRTVIAPSRPPIAGISAAATFRPWEAIARYPTDFARAPRDIEPGYYQVRWNVPSPSGLVDQVVNAEFVVAAEARPSTPRPPLRARRARDAAPD